ncbi:hypothetical protein P167DRAFT_549065 [Morchella conica CCBAS932]|uniref:A-kinase anchor protein 7-like phosphoesterase domain-containing protein n=1 Tax=Morchella conica CCBAS932 TaxID=1392247 RepID=A0A3N4KJ10_9PEZI|nr:hypothetical protein P167DRAFT_549065 [Morchella conica CCBAS932]
MESPLSMESSSSTDSPSSMESPPSMESPSSMEFPFSMESTSPMASQFSTEPTPPPPKPKHKPTPHPPKPKPKPKPTHFLCLPLGHNPPLTPAPSPFNETLLTMTNTLTSYLHQDQKVVLTSAIRPASALMIPLGQLSLPTYAAERAVIKLLNEINFRYLVRQVTWGGGYETIETDLRGLETGSGKWRTGVLYTVPTGNKIADGYERLRDFVAAVRKEFFDGGFLIPEPRYKEEQDPSEEVKLPEIKLKVTVVNTVYSGGPRVRVHKFDAEAAVRKYQGKRLAKDVIVGSVAICRFDEGRGMSMDGWDPVAAVGFEGKTGGLLSIGGLFEKVMVVLQTLGQEVQREAASQVSCASHRIKVFLLAS